MSKINWYRTAEFSTTLPGDLPGIIVLEGINSLDDVVARFSSEKMTEFHLNPFTTESRIWLSASHGQDYIVHVENETGNVLAIVDPQSKYYDTDEQCIKVLVYKA